MAKAEVSPPASILILIHSSPLTLALSLSFKYCNTFQFAPVFFLYTLLLTLVYPLCCVPVSLPFYNGFLLSYYIHRTFSLLSLLSPSNLLVLVASHHLYFHCFDLTWVSLAQSNITTVMLSQSGFCTISRLTNSLIHFLHGTLVYILR